MKAMSNVKCQAVTSDDWQSKVADPRPISSLTSPHLHFLPTPRSDKYHTHKLKMNNEADDFEIDPAIAAAMGFSGFGTQPNKKRKFNANEGFVDPEIGKAGKAATGANNMPVRQSKIANPAEDEPKSIVPEATTSDHAASGQNEKPSLEALRQGVPNQRGDMVYFLPSFIEDPWTNLKGQ